MAEMEFSYAFRGSSAGINSAEFYVCQKCGACVVEMHGSEAARGFHRSWHRWQEEARRG